MALPTRPSADDLTALSKLTITTGKPKATSKRKSKKTQQVADSWEDEAQSDTATETEADIQESLGRMRTQNPPDVPPPTPASPSAKGKDYPEGILTTSLDAQTVGAQEEEGEEVIPRYGPNGEILPDPEPVRRHTRMQDPDKRPDKTTSVAARLIAGGLGVRAPRRTEEEREYDRVMKEKAKKKRDEERALDKAGQSSGNSAWED